MTDRLDGKLRKDHILERVRRLERFRMEAGAVAKRRYEMPPIPTTLSYSLDTEDIDNTLWGKADLSWDAVNVEHWIVGYQETGENESHTYPTKTNMLSLRQLRPGRQYYIWVYSYNSRSGLASDPAYFNGGNLITMPYAGIPAIPSGLTSDFSGGDLALSWNPNQESDQRDYVLQIWESNAKVQCLQLSYTDTTRYTWTFETNVAQNAAYVLDPDPSVYVELQARNWGGRLSTAATLTATNPVPSTPGQPIGQRSFEALIWRTEPVSDTDISYYEWDVELSEDGGGYATVDGSPFEDGLIVTYGGHL